MPAVAIPVLAYGLLSQGQILQADARHGWNSRAERSGNNRNMNLGGDLSTQRTSAVRRGVVLSAVILVATVSAGVLLYTQGKHTLQEQVNQVELRGGLGATEMNRDLLKRFDQIALGITAIAVVGSAGCLAPLFITSRNWRRRATGQLEYKLQDLQASVGSLQSQLAEARRLREGLVNTQNKLEEEVQILRQSNARMEEELEKRNRSEKVWKQKGQELEVSKNVLELNVLARTQQLQLLQRRYEMILNSAGEGICGFDLEGRTTFVNPTVAKLTGWNVAELIGKKEHQMFGSNGSGEKQAPMATGTPGELSLTRKDGSTLPVEFVKTPLTEDGRELGFVVVFKDITERKKVDETLAQKAAELARSNAELEQFAFVASHDLQEPLRKIQSFGDRLKVKCEGAGSPEIRDYLDRMQGAAARMRTLINDLLTFSRVIRRSEPFVPVDLGAVTREVLSDLEVVIEKRHALVKVEALPTLDADPMQIRQLMLNLMSNALKFQPAEGTPEVQVRSRTVTSVSGDSLCEIIVQDNGIGFDEKYTDKMFAVFQRLHGRGEYEGTGVGLAVCRRIVDRHHGTITAKSKPGQGATFTVTLPTKQSQPEMPAAR